MGGLAGVPSVPPEVSRGRQSVFCKGQAWIHQVNSKALLRNYRNNVIFIGTKARFSLVNAGDICS